MTWKTKRERSQYYSMLLMGQILHLNSSFQTLYEQVEFADMTTSELYDNFKPPKTPTYNQMKNIEVFEDFFAQEIAQFFDTLKKTEVLHKYDVKFTVRPKNKYKVTKEKMKMLKK